MHTNSTGYSEPFDPQELDARNHSLLRTVDDLRNEVNHWRARCEEAQKALDSMKKDQMAMLGTNYDSMSHMHRLHTQNTTLYSQKELEGIRNEELQNQLKKLLIENESLKHRLESYEDSTKLSMANLSSMISDKGKDLSDMKWKLNDALELKRRSEMDKETMVFELENLRARYVADLREK